MYNEETICAIATGMGNSGVGIIRISGTKAFDILDKIFKPVNKKKKIKEMKTYTAAFGEVYDGSQLIDEAIVLVMKAPHTYTCEDVCEIQCHGGMMVMKKIMETVIKQGARAAEPGEFTKRAFLNGRIDLSQAESVMDLIQAKNEFAVKSSLMQLKGGLRRRIEDLREAILYQVAYIESALDDPEHYSLEGFPQKLQEIVDNLVDNVDKLLITFDNGKVLKEGIRTVIVGKPNAGKSSLLNLFLGEDRAIVTDIAGTTRDILEEVVNIQGIILNIVDTAGIRTTDDVVERIGVDKALDSVDKADLILYVVDGSVALDNNDFQIIPRIKKKNVITIINKSDLDVVVDKMLIRNELDGDIVEISAKSGEGIEQLYQLLNDKFFAGKLSYNDELYITNTRHKDELLQTKNSLMKVSESIHMGMEEDFFSIDLMDAYAHLGNIIGETTGDDLADKIFKEFCMGK